MCCSGHTSWPGRPAAAKVLACAAYVLSAYKLHTAFCTLSQSAAYYAQLFCRSDTEHKMLTERAHWPGVLVQDWLVIQLCPSAAAAQRLSVELRHALASSPCRAFALSWPAKAMQVLDSCYLCAGYNHDNGHDAALDIFAVCAAVTARGVGCTSPQPSVSCARLHCTARRAIHALEDMLIVIIA